MNKWSGKGHWIPWMSVSFGTTLPTMREVSVQHSSEEVKWQKGCQ